MQTLFQKNLEILFSNQTIKSKYLEEKFLEYNDKINKLKIDVNQCIHYKINSIRDQDYSDQEFDGFEHEEPRPSKSFIKKIIKKSNHASNIFLKNLTSEQICKNSKIFALDAIDLTQILVNSCVSQNIQGGLVIQNAEFVNESVVSVDFKSLYPSLILKYNLDSSAYSYWSQFLIYIAELNIYVSPFDNKYISQIPIPIKYNTFLIYSLGFLIRSEVCKSITSKYLIKKMQDRDEIKVMLGRQLCLNEREYLLNKELYIKLLMNTIYGNLNNVYCNSYLPELAAIITMKGRNQLFSLSMFIKLYCIQHQLTTNLFTIYGDTDSIFSKFVHNKNINAKYMSYLNMQYKNSAEMQKFYLNWKMLDGASVEEFKNESLKRWNLQAILDRTDDSKQNSNENLEDSAIKQILKNNIPNNWANIYSILKNEIRDSDSELCVFILNDIINKYGLLERNCIRPSNQESQANTAPQASDLVISLKIENHFKPFILLKKKNYISKVNELVFSKGSLFNKTQCIAVREFLFNFCKLLTDKNFSKQKLVNIFKIYTNSPDELFLMKEIMTSSLQEYKGSQHRLSQLRFLAAKKFFQKDFYFSYYKMFFETPLFGTVLDYKNEYHCMFLNSNRGSTLLYDDLKKLLIKANIDDIEFITKSNMKPISKNDLKVDKEFILKKSIKNFIETLNKLLIEQGYKNFSDTFTRVWLHVFGSKFIFKTEVKRKEYSHDSFLQIQAKRMKYNFKSPNLY